MAGGVVIKPNGNGATESIQGMVKITDDYKSEEAVTSISPKGVRNAINENMLDSRLVAMTIPHRGIWYDKTRMYAQYSEGGGTCWSEDYKGFAGTIDKDNDRSYMGVAYGNFLANQVTSGGSATTISSTGIVHSTIAQVGDTYDVLNLLSAITGTITIEIEVLYSDLTDKSCEGIFTVGDSTTLFEGSQTSNGEEYWVQGKKHRHQVTLAGNMTGINIQYGWNDTNQVGEEVKFKLSILTVDAPAVPRNAPWGRWTIDEPTDLNTQTVIISAYGGSSVDNYNRFIAGVQGEYYDDTETNHLQKNWAIIGNGYAKVIYDDLTENDLKLHTSAFLLDRTSMLGTAADDGVYSTRWTQGFFKYDGVLTEAEAREELRKIKSGNFQVDEKFIGSNHAIPYANTKRDDEGSLASAGYKLDQTELFDGLNATYAYGDGVVCGDIVTMNIAVNANTPWNSLLGWVREGYRPIADHHFVVSDSNGTTYGGMVRVRADGELRTYFNAPAGVTFYGCITFIRRRALY